MLSDHGCFFDVVEDWPFLVPGDLDVSGIDPGRVLADDEVASGSALVLGTIR